MTLLYYSRRFLDHDTGPHPERAARIEKLLDYLEGQGLAQHCARPEWSSVTPERLHRVHPQEYADRLRQICDQGGGRLDPDTVVSRASCEVALLASGAVCDATERVLRGEDSQALCLVRPPGHHALSATAMGFCLFNHVAVAARMAIDEFQVERVLIVDWDVHHGNGTQELFWEDPQVGYFSMHRWPFYPGTGSAEETGAGPGAGMTLNLPLEAGTSRDRILSQFKRQLDDFADHVRPQLVFISAGFDAHREDPIGSLGLESEDFEYLTAAVLDVAATYSDGRVVSLLEGGYNIDRVAESVAAHLREMLDRQGKPV